MNLNKVIRLSAELSKAFDELNELQAQSISESDEARRAKLHQARKRVDVLSARFKAATSGQITSELVLALEEDLRHAEMLVKTAEQTTKELDTQRLNTEWLHDK